jgi:formylglycine-generating enzyme required for sulfatase activity
VKLRLSSFVLLLVTCGLRAAPAEQPATTPPRETTNSIDMKLVLVPAGEFMMGSTESMDDLLKAFPTYKVEAQSGGFFKDEFPRHRVRITKPFYLGRYAVTVGQFKKFVEGTGYRTEAEQSDAGRTERQRVDRAHRGNGGWGYNPKSGKCEGRNPKYNWRNPGFAQTDDHPVVDVTWHDAVAFCQWLSRKEGKTYKLPTEAQWEYACRAGTSTRYSNGDDPDHLARVANVQDVAGRREFPHVHEIIMPKDGKFTVAVGTLPPNSFGLYDMHGNVWQWCSDRYGEDYYAKSPVDDPTGPETGNRRVRRGGGWNSFPLYARASFRNWNVPESRCVNVGFRVLREP